jgi:adenine-specific DNA-methyltransferase
VDVTDETERYEFNWIGKKSAILECSIPSRKTLRPVIHESKDWDTTENLYIEGDNLDVLKLLQKSYGNRIKMIYIDIKTPRLIQFNYSYSRFAA